MANCTEEDNTKANAKDPGRFYGVVLNRSHCSKETNKTEDEEDVFFHDFIILAFCSAQGLDLSLKEVLASANTCQTDQECRSTDEPSQKQHTLIPGLRALNTCNQKGNNRKEKNHEVVHTHIIVLFCFVLSGP